VKTDRSEYLVGQPVWVIVEAANVGTEALGYSNCDGHAGLTVPGGQRKQTPNLHGCYRGEGSGSGCGLYDPPLLQPGKSVSFHYLLKGYRLRSGEYDLHASGKAGVRDPVEGATFDVWLRFRVREGTEAELRQRYASYVEEAATGSGMTGPSREAREAIAEMAPPFLEKTILSFANQPETASLAVEGLAQIATDTSRADLARLYENSADLRLRAAIVKALAGIATAAELPFFASLLPGHSGALDDEIRVSAVLGIGRLGGESAVRALTPALRSASAAVRQAAVEALGNTRSATAVPVLIEMSADETVHNDVCGALSTLTHLGWCGGVLPGEEQALWRQWWSDRQSRLLLYGNDQCVEPSQLVPLDR
jgi:hypothetical protein